MGRVRVGSALSQLAKKKNQDHPLLRKKSIQNYGVHGLGGVYKRHYEVVETMLALHFAYIPFFSVSLLHRLTHR
jgi:hypothetical protein